MEYGRLDEAEAEFVEANRLGGQLFGDPVVGLLSTTHLALLQAHRGNATAFRQLAEEAYSRARGRWRWFEALCGHVLASALVVWGESERAEKLMGQSFEYLSRIKARWHLHVALTVMARKEWQQGRPARARAYFDQALELAARPDPQARRAAVYPLSAIGGGQAGDVLHRLLRDDDEVVRDRALLVLKVTPSPAADPTPTRQLAAAVLGTMMVHVNRKPVIRWRTPRPYSPHSTLPCTISAGLWKAMVRRESC